jgi:hypothetical protein
LAASHLFSCFKIVFLIDIKSNIAINAPIKIATTQAVATFQTIDQLTIDNHEEVTQAQINPQKIE